MMAKIDGSIHIRAQPGHSLICHIIKAQLIFTCLKR